MAHPTLFDPYPTCDCDVEEVACCLDSVAAALAERGAAILAAAARERLESGRFAQLVLDCRVQRRDPLAVPEGWRLYVGQLAADPQIERAVAAGTLPVHRAAGRIGAPPAETRLAGLLIAAREVLDGGRFDVDEAHVAVLSLSAGGVTFAPAARLARWISNVPAAHHLVLRGRPLADGPRTRICPTAVSPHADVVDVAALVVTADRCLVEPPQRDRGLVAGPLVPSDLAGDLHATFAAAAKRLLTAGTALPSVRSAQLVTLGRDLTLAGQPEAHGLVVLDADSSTLYRAGLQVTALPDDDVAAGKVLQARSATSAPVGRVHRANLDVVGTALRESRLELPSRPQLQLVR